MEQILNVLNEGQGLMFLVLALAVIIVALVINKNIKINLSTKGLSFQKENDETLGTIISIINAQTASNQSEFIEINNKRETCYSDQIDYTKDKFKSIKIDAEKILAAYSEKKDPNDELLLSLLFDKMFSEYRDIVMGIIKKNHLAEKTEFQLQEQVDAQTKFHLDYISKKFDTISMTIDTKIFLDEYERLIRKATSESIINARNLSIKREEDIKEIRRIHSEERRVSMKQYLIDTRGMKEEDANFIVDKAF